MPIAALGIGTGKAVEHCGLRDFEVGQSQDRPRDGVLFFTTKGSLHDLRPPIATGYSSAETDGARSELRVIQEQRGNTT
jgi:hypothetical protein